MGGWGVIGVQGWWGPGVVRVGGVHRVGRVVGVKGTGG